MKRFAVSAAVLLATPLLAVSGSAGAAPTAITLGETAVSPVVTCGGGGTVIQRAVAPGGASYTVPGQGVVTSISVQTNPNAGQTVRLGVFGAPTGAVYPVMAKSATFALVPSTLNTFPVQVPVQAGWTIGAQFTGTNVACGVQTFTAADDLYFSGDSLDGASVNSGALGGGSADFHVNLSAVWEPDTDGDGYGDVSQDLCPQSAVSHVACVPDTTVGKKPAKHGTHRTVKVKFTSSIAGSTFTCKLDGKSAKPCTSPYKPKVKLGKHTITITAISPAGQADPTPAVVKFKVVAPKPR
jgi:hypothetical protein